MTNQTVARRYAQALLTLGREDGNYVKYGEELGGFAELMALSELSTALTDPIYPSHVRKNILDAVIKRLGLAGMIVNFLRLLQDKGRIVLVAAIHDHYQRLVDEVNNVTRAAVVTADPLNPALVGKLQAVLEKITGKTVHITSRQDPGIIGGLVAKVGDLTLDGSIKSQLANLKESLVKG